MKIMLPILWYDSFMGLSGIIDDFKNGNEIRFFAPPYHIYRLLAYSGDFGHLNRRRSAACSGASRSLIPVQSGRFRADYAAYITFNNYTEGHK